MKLTTESKFLLGILLGTAAIVALAVIIMSRPAKPLAKTDLIPNNTYTLGNPEAANWLVEFSDYQCPACGAFEPTVSKLTKENKDKLYFAYRHFPLSQHPMSVPAAAAAEAAGLSGKYWEMHELLFKNQADLANELFPQLAQELKLDLTKFAKDSASVEIKNKINRDLLYGERIGISATPTFYLNGLKLSPATPADLESIVLRSLK